MKGLSFFLLLTLQRTAISKYPKVQLDAAFTSCLTCEQPRALPER